VSPVGVQGVRSMRQKRTSSPKRKLQQLPPDPGQYTRCSVAYRPASAPTATARRQRSRSPEKDGGALGFSHMQRKSKKERCQECTKPIVGKGRTLPSNVIPKLRNTSAYVQTVSPDALIQNYLDSGYPTMNRSEDMLFCSWNCAKAWNHQNSHAIVKGRTEERIVQEEEKEEQQHHRDDRAQTLR